MIFPWKSSKIDLKDFDNFLALNIPNADGIVAGPEHFEVVEKNLLTSSERSALIAYYNSLNT